MIGYYLLRYFYPTVSSSGNGCHCTDRLESIFGPEFKSLINGKTVIDYGCGAGIESIEMAKAGASVIGLDVRESILEVAKVNALNAGVECEFSAAANREADVIASLDAFEHFQDPAAVLRHMHSLLKPNGKVFISFGPTWYHPRGGHLFSVFPWAHLVFSESDLCRWRSRFKDDGAMRFCDVEGGLNQMTILRFCKLVAASPFRCEFFGAVPIKALRHVHNRLTREFTTSIIKCVLERC